MPDHIEVELGNEDLAGIDFSCQNGVLIEALIGQRRPNGLMVPLPPRVKGSLIRYHGIGIIGGIISTARKLTGGKHEAARLRVQYVSWLGHLRVRRPLGAQ